MQKIRVPVIAIILLCFVTISKAQNQKPIFFHYAPNNGFTYRNATAFCKDSIGFLWIGTSNGLFRYDAYEFLNFQANPADTNSLQSSGIKCLNMFNSEMWIGTDNGISRLNTEDYSFRNFKLSDFSNDNKDDNVVDIANVNDTVMFIGTAGGLWQYSENRGFRKYIPDDKSNNAIGNSGTMDIYKSVLGQVWVSIWEYGVYRYRIESNDFEPIDAINEQKIFCLGGDAKGRLFVGEHYKGVYCYNYEDESYVEVLPSVFSGVLIRDIECDGKGEIWVATQNEGLIKVSEDLKHFEQFLPHTDDDYSISDDVIFSLYYDAEQDVMWVGNANKGFDKLCFSLPFSKYLNTPSFKQKGNYSIRRSWVDKYQNLWFVTESAGLLKYDTLHEFSSFYTNQNGVLFDDINPNYHISPQGNFAYLDDSVIFTYDNTHKCFEKSNNFPDSLFFNSTLNYKLFSRYGGNLWVLTQQNIWAVDSSGKLYDCNWITQSSNLQYQFINNIYIDLYRQVWVLTNNGLWRGDIGNKKMEKVIDKGYFYLAQSWLNGSVFATNNTVYYFVKDQLQKSLSFEDKNSGINIREMASLSSGDVWLSSYSGLIHISAPNFTISYNKTHTYREIYHNLLLALPDNKLLIGGSNNIEIANFNESYSSIIKTGVQITGTYVDGEKIKPRDEVILNFNQKVIGFEFSALDFNQPAGIDYAYMLEGYERDWITTSWENRNVNYSHLPGGRYTFKVKAKVADESWGEIATCKVVIKPPLYKTTWVQVISILLIVLMTGAIVVLRILNERRKNIRLEKLVKERTVQVQAQNKELEEQSDLLQEQNIALSESYNKIKEQAQEVAETNAELQKMVEVKDRLFSVIGHDLRNPFQIILSNASKLVEDKLSESKKESLQAGILKSSREAFSLLSDLLDWGKSQSLSDFHKHQAIDLHEMTENIIRVAMPQAIRKKVKLVNLIPIGTQMYSIETMLSTIIRNLVINGIKFCNADDQVSVLLENKDDVMKITVKDTGIGMEDTLVKNIFDLKNKPSTTGTQGERGSGLGLVICKEFADFLGIEMLINSTVNVGTEFILLLHNIKIIDKKIEDKPEIKVPVIKDDKDIDIQILVGKSVLIVEDNETIRQNLSETLQGFDKVFEADNGAEGIKMAKSILPDIVITDLMMPQFNGYELCSALKNDTNTSHIPVLILTAVSGIEAQKAGLKTGADDYIVKPFHADLLILKVVNILKVREQLRLKFAKAVAPIPSEAVNNSLDENFLEKAIDVVYQNLLNPNFDSNDLIKEMGMSRTAFFVKIKSLSGYSATEFIRVLRVKKAAQMMQNSQNNVSEIAYDVGFSNRIYFTRCFKEVFGKTPKEYLQEIR